MTIDANLILGFQLGIVVGIIVGIIGAFAVLLVMGAAKLNNDHRVGNGRGNE